MESIDIFFLVIYSILLISIQLLWTKIIKEFTLSTKLYIIIAGFFTTINVVFCIIDKKPSIDMFFLLWIFMILLNLSIIDAKYYEISGNSYYFMIIPIIGYMFTNTMYPWWTTLISAIILLIVFMILDKIVGIEKIGGADVKLMLLSALMFSYKEILIFIIFTFAVDLLLYILLSIINFIKKGPKGIKIPMIIAISIATLLLVIFCKYVFYV